MNKTYSAKPSDITREWVLLDASELPLGRLATAAAEQLIGKLKPTYTPHIDGGNYVIVINAAKLKVSGQKTTDKIYHRHSEYPGGIKSRTLNEQMALDPRKVIEKAIKGMLPKNKLQAERLRRLKVFVDAEHSHTAQQPRKLGVR